MNSKILICYKSITGFTRKYAEMTADRTGGTLMDLRDVTAGIVSQYDLVVFGGRFRAGMVDGLKKAKKLADREGKTLVVFATGAMPDTAEETLKQTWENNLTAAGMHRIAHFYLPGGLCYEKLPCHERIMMKAFAAVMKDRLSRKSEKTQEEQAFMRMISTSYDISSEEYIRPLVSFLKGEQDR